TLELSLGQSPPILGDLGGESPGNEASHSHRTDVKTKLAEVSGRRADAASSQGLDGPLYIACNQSRVGSKPG
ncbi:hypothetical protein, partial [Phormidesmis sp. 146-33]